MADDLKETEASPEKRTGTRYQAVVGVAVAIFIVTCAVTGWLYNGPSKAPDGSTSGSQTSAPAK
jgi:hypothetical protein